MSKFGSDKRPVVDSLDRVIIDAVKHEQFMTCREIWKEVHRENWNISPGLVYRKVGNLVEMGALGYIEKKMGGAYLRRYYCFEDDMESFRDRYSFIENL